MILTGNAIHKAWRNHEIVIDPFEMSQINPNSYNYRLGATLIEVKTSLANVDGDHHIELREEGYELQPDRLYLGATYERIGSGSHVTTLLGRSSLGRLGLFLNVSADLGHCGAISRWTLELKVVQPLRVYPGMIIGQVCFWKQHGGKPIYDGRYQSDVLPRANTDHRLYADRAVL